MCLRSLISYLRPIPQSINIAALVVEIIEQFPLLPEANTANLVSIVSIKLYIEVYVVPYDENNFIHVKHKIKGWFQRNYSHCMAS